MKGNLMSTWMKMKPETEQKEKLTKAIASQILRHRLPRLHHPAMEYVVEEDEVLSESELAKAVAKWSTGDCLGRWRSLPGRTISDTLQTCVTKKIIGAEYAGVALESTVPHLLIKDADGEQKIGISEGIPMIAPPERRDQYSAYKTAGLYLLVNPPTAKGKMEPTPLEEQTDGAMVPKGVVEFKQWNEEKEIFEGPFETFYANGKPTVHQLESVYLTQTPVDSMKLQSRTLEIIEPTYAKSEYLHHKVIGDGKKGRKLVLKPSVKPKLPTSLSLTWRVWARANLLSRVKSVYEPFFGCLLPPGLAWKVHVMGNVMWSLRQMGCVGVAASSECAVWTKAKSLGELNVPIWSRASTEEMADAVNGLYKPGTYRYFERALQIIDVAGKGVPSMPKKSVQFSPLQVADVITGMHKTMVDTKMTSRETPVAYVAYLDPALAQLAKHGWSFYPLDFSTGQIMISQEGKGVPFDKLAEMFARFLMYRIYYPFIRIPWPKLAVELQVPIVTVRNGKPMLGEQEENWFAQATMVDKPDVDEVELDGEGLAALVESATFTLMGPEDPTFEVSEVIPLEDKPIINLNKQVPSAHQAAPEPQQPPADELSDDENEDLFGMFQSREVTKEEAALLAQRQKEMQEKAKKKE